MCIGVKLQKRQSRSLFPPCQKAEPYRCGRPVEPPHLASSSHFRGVNRLSTSKTAVSVNTHQSL